MNDIVSGPRRRIASVVRARSRPRSSNTIATSGRLPEGGVGTAKRSQAGLATGGGGNAGGGRNAASSVGLADSAGFSGGAIGPLGEAGGASGALGRGDC